MNKRIIALTTAAALVAAPAAVLVAGPAQADGPERHARGTVAGASYDMSAEKGRGFEVSADDGKKIGSQTLRAVPDDGRHEVDFRDFRSANTAGKDVFTVKISRVDGAGSVTRKLTFAS
jgi:hypothetical protein